MPPVTLEAIHAKQTELATMIQQLEKQAASSTMIEVEACTITLQAGEHYAGTVLDDSGQHKHHLVLMVQRPTDDLAWQAAMDWAGRVGGALPTRQELSLIFANCKPHLKPKWHWSGDAYESDASYAWSCHFGLGDIFINHKSFEGSAVAVRRV